MRNTIKHAILTTLATLTRALAAYSYAPPICRCGGGMIMSLRVGLWIALLGASALLLSSCGAVLTNDYEISLPQGYRIDRTQEKIVAVVNPESVGIVDPKLDGYCVYNDVLVGHVSKCTVPDVPSTPGYFIVEFRSGKVHKGLSEKQWLAKLHSYGIRRSPVLHIPSASDEANGFNQPVKP